MQNGIQNEVVAKAVGHMGSLSLCGTFCAYVNTFQFIYICPYLLLMLDDCDPAVQSEVGYGTALRAKRHDWLI